MKEQAWAIVRNVVLFLGGGFFGTFYATHYMPTPNANAVDRAKACQAVFDEGTVLYEPGEALSVPLLHGLVNLQAGAITGLQTPAHPQWFIPARIEPRMMQGTSGLVYAHIDGAGHVKGPYMATSVAPGDEFNYSGWSAR